MHKSGFIAAIGAAVLMLVSPAAAGSVLEFDEGVALGWLKAPTLQEQHGFIGGFNGDAPATWMTHLPDTQMTPRTFAGTHSASPGATASAELGMWTAHNSFSTAGWVQAMLDESADQGTSAGAEMQVNLHFTLHDPAPVRFTGSFDASELNAAFSRLTVGSAGDQQTLAEFFAVGDQGQFDQTMQLGPGQYSLSTLVDVSAFGGAGAVTDEGWFDIQVQAVPLPAAAWSSLALLGAMGAGAAVRRRRRVAHLLAS